MNSNAEIVAALKGKDDGQRAEAIRAAPAIGATVVPAIAPLLGGADVEVRRAARRALEGIVHHAARTGIGKEARAVETALIAALKIDAVAVRREVLWLLSEIGGDDCVAAVSPFLANVALREDARCVLQRIPGGKSLRALKDALRAAPEDFRPNVAESLRKRGEKVSGYPSQRLVPTKKTAVPMLQ